MTDYEMVAGTEPDIDEQHEPRTVKRVNNDSLFMMSEVGDGCFVQWGTCFRCSQRVATCTCPGGPEEPPYIESWRANRFRDSFKTRNVPPALPVVLKTRDRRINAVLRLLRSDGWTITNPFRVSEDLATTSRKHHPVPDSEDLPTTKEEVIALGEAELTRNHPTLAAELGVGTKKEFLPFACVYGCGTEAKTQDEINVHYDERHRTGEESLDVGF